MTDTSELQKLLDSIRLPLSAVDTADYAEVFDEDGQKVALTVQPKILVAGVNAMPEYIEQQATISRLTAERDALVEALNAIQVGLDRSLDALNEPMSMLNAQELSDRFANDICEVIRHAIARALVRDAEL